MFSNTDGVTKSVNGRCSQNKNVFAATFAARLGGGRWLGAPTPPVVVVWVAGLEGWSRAGGAKRKREKERERERAKRKRYTIQTRGRGPSNSNEQTGSESRGEHESGQLFWKE